MEYAVVVNKRKIDFLLDGGLKPLCGIGDAAVFPLNEKYRDLVDRLEIYRWFGIPYADFIPTAKYRSIYK